MTAKWYAQQKGWTLARANVIVEGNLDVRYFQLASRLWRTKTTHALIDDQFRVHSAGTGDAGGTDGVFREFVTLFNLAQVDLDANGRRQYRVAALFDDDLAGRAKAAQLLRGNRTLQMGRDVFMLRRSWPLLQLAPELIEKHLREANSACGTLACEIEDLLSPSLVDLFLQEKPQFRKPKLQAGTAFHVDWSDDAKHALVRFAEEYASYDELSGLLAMVVGLRHYLGQPVQAGWREAAG
jgi:hypothetical protein